MTEKIKLIHAKLHHPQKVNEAFQAIETLLQGGFKHLLASFNLQRVAYRDLQKNLRLERFSNKEEYEVQLNRILREINNLLFKVMEEERRVSGSDVLIHSDLSAYSCSRKKIIKRFSINFDWKEENQLRTHFYLVAHQELGSADNLIRRLISIVHEDREKVKYPGFNDLAIHPIELEEEDTLKVGQTRFLNAFNHSLTHTTTNLFELDQSIGTSYPALQGYDYLPFAFQVSFGGKSFAVVRKLLNWITQDFSKLPSYGRRKYLFFFILRFKETKVLRLRAKKGLVNSSEDFQQLLEGMHKVQKGITVLPRLNKVSIRDIDEWYQKIEPDPIRRSHVVKQFINHLGGGLEWDMALIERELTSVVANYRKLLL